MAKPTRPDTDSPRPTACYQHRLGVRATLLGSLLCIVGWMLIFDTPCAYGGTIRHDRSDSSYTSLAASYPSVGDLTWPGYRGSATLIADNWILSAAHCLDADGLSASDWTFDLTDSGGGIHVGAEIFVYPDWTTSGKDPYAGVDIALLRLNTSESSVNPATLNSNTTEVGRTATHVGYGKTGTGITGMVNPSGTKRAGNNVVDLDGSLVGLNDKVLIEDFDSVAAGNNIYGSASPLDLEYLIASGDSGGGMFMDFGSGDVLVGVHSFISSFDGEANADYGDISGSIRVSSYLSWINTTVEGNDPIAPELASGLMWLFFAGGLLLYRARRRATSAQPRLAPHA